MLKTMDEKLELLGTFETGYVTDALNLLGIKNCCIDNVLPIKKGKLIVGQAFTVQISRIRGYEKFFGLYEVVESCQAGSILVYAGAEGSVLLGENIITTIDNRGVKAVVLDGKCRDIDGIEEVEMPVFCEGVGVRLSTPDLQVTGLNVPIFIHNVKVNPRDIIIGDSDGVVVIPLEKVDDVLKQVEWIAKIEHEASEALKKKVSIKEFKKIISKKNEPTV